VRDILKMLELIWLRIAMDTVEQRAFPGQKQKTTE
jgi:hypothetical protein